MYLAAPPPQTLRFAQGDTKGAFCKRLKGDIVSFEQAVSKKIKEIVEDLQPTIKQASFFPTPSSQDEIRLYNSSCLETIPTFEGSTYDAIITSPPYCNRYDYTRTYTLELALLDIDEKV